MTRSRAVRDNVVVGCSGFQDYKGLAKLAEQTCPHVFKFVYVDGVYDFFKLKSNQSPFSTDGSLELADKYDNFEVIKFNGYQPDKRQRYVDRAAQLGASCLMVIDTDEWIHPKYTNWDLFYDQLEAEVDRYGRFHRIWNMMIHVDADYELAENAVTRGEWSIGAGRIWYRPEELEYYGGIHYWVRRKQTTDPFERLMSTDKMVDQGVRLHTSSALRTQEFRDARNKWARKGMEYEEKLINQYNSTVVTSLQQFSKNTTYQAKLFPLIAIPTYYENAVRKEGIIKNNKYADLLFVEGPNNHWGQQSVLARIFRYFQNKSGYSHLVIAPFHTNWNQAHYDILYKDARDDDFTIISGFSFKPPQSVDVGDSLPLVMEDDKQSRANFILPNEDKISGYQELRSNATRQEIDAYIKVFRQKTIAIKRISDFSLTFIRNDIVKFIGDLDTAENRGYPTAAEMLSARLERIGIMQYVDLTCNIENLNHLDKEIFKPIESDNGTYSTYEGKY